ncbi:uncharacterized protein [Miscanthus floridulus]|uniref:uncharacterized protein n=1 Tax=Miscanthus floridulus TaxID=154761 RepID=UPI00345873F8
MATSDHIPELSIIASQSTLGVELLSQAFKSTPTKPSSVDPQKKLILVETTDASKTVEDKNPSTSLPNVVKALNSPALSYSFNFEEYIDEDEISSSAISSKEALLEEIKNRLKDMLPMLKKNIADLVQDTDLVRRTFLAIKGNLHSNLVEVRTPLSNIEDQAPRVKRAKRNLADRKALLAKKNFNKQEAKELAQLIDNLKNSSLRIELELNQLKVKHSELEKELENVKAIIDRHESNLAQIPNAIKQKKQKMLTKVKEGKAICSTLENISRLAEEDKQQIVEVDAIQLKALKII